MEDEESLVLVLNDDGVVAKGINELMRFLRPLGNIVVIVPGVPRSGSGCALTATQPVRYQLVKREAGLTVYECSGAPTDCIRLVRNTVLDRIPDLVVGGINHGDNSVINVYYSGTMEVVFEGCLSGISSIGFSLCSHTPDADFEATGPYIHSIAAVVLEKGFPPLTYLNADFPDTTDIKGTKICEQAKGRWTNKWVAYSRLNDPNYLWLTDEFTDHKFENERNDHWALASGYVAIAPTTVDVTAYYFMDELNKWFG